MKKTKFDKNVQILTYKPNTCLNSGEHSCLVFSNLFVGKNCSNMLGSFRSRIFFSPPKSDVHSHLSLTLYTDKLTPSERTAFKKASRWSFVLLPLGLE